MGTQKKAFGLSAINLPRMFVLLACGVELTTGQFFVEYRIHQPLLIKDTSHKKSMLDIFLCTGFRKEIGQYRKEVNGSIFYSTLTTVTSTHHN